MHYTFEALKLYFLESGLNLTENLEILFLFNSRNEFVLFSYKYN